MKIKKILLIIVLILIIIASIILITRNTKTEKSQKEDGKLHVVSSNFASYDFLRAIIGDTEDVELTFLLGPGKDTHSYDPTAADLITIQNADLFVYIGGEMEQWSDKVLDSIDTNKVICIADDIETIEEAEVDGAELEDDEDEEEGAFDEHIWTSPANAIKMVETLANCMKELDPQNGQTYENNAEQYIEKIKNVDNDTQEVIDNRVRDRLLFGDKMPMQYFINYYNLKVSAAFSGCSTETEPSASTVAYLVEKAKEEEMPVILYCELNEGKVAKTIAKEVGNNCEAMQIQALHNVSKDDFDNGETWVSLMERNIPVLKKALQ